MLNASLPTIKRLPSYLHVIEEARREGMDYISGRRIAEELNIDPIQVRKDLAVTGIVGTPRVGFPVRELIQAINSFLAWNQPRQAILVGAGNLGSALMGYVELKRHGMVIMAAFDRDPGKVGGTIHGIPVHASEELSMRVPQSGANIAILTVPSEQAQIMAEQLVSSGIGAIWNFTNVKLKVPGNIIVQKEDLSSGYAVLSVKMRTLA